MVCDIEILIFKEDKRISVGSSFLDVIYLVTSASYSCSFNSTNYFGSFIFQWILSLSWSGHRNVLFLFKWSKYKEIYGIRKDNAYSFNFFWCLPFLTDKVVRLNWYRFFIGISSSSYLVFACFLLQLNQ